MQVSQLRHSRDAAADSEPGAMQSPSQPVSITQMLEERAHGLEEELLQLDAELRRRFGDASYSVDRSEQVLGAMQRLRWAIARSPVANPLFPQTTSDDSAEV